MERLLQRPRPRVYIMLHLSTTLVGLGSHHLSASPEHRLHPSLLGEGPGRGLERLRFGGRHLGTSCRGGQPEGFGSAASESSGFEVKGLFGFGMVWGSHASMSAIHLSGGRGWCRGSMRSLRILEPACLIIFFCIVREPCAVRCLPGPRGQSADPHAEAAPVPELRAPSFV